MPARAWGFKSPLRHACCTRSRSCSAMTRRCVVVGDPDAELGVHLGLVLRVGRGQHRGDVAQLSDELRICALVSFPAGTGARAPARPAGARPGPRPSIRRRPPDPPGVKGRPVLGEPVVAVRELAAGCLGPGLGRVVGVTGHGQSLARRRRGWPGRTVRRATRRASGRWPTRGRRRSSGGRVLLAERVLGGELAPVVGGVVGRSCPASGGRRARSARGRTGRRCGRSSASSGGRPVAPAAICAWTAAKSSELTSASWVGSVDQIQSARSFHRSFVSWPAATSSTSRSTSSRRWRFQTWRPV